MKIIDEARWRLNLREDDELFDLYCLVQWVSLVEKLAWWQLRKRLSDRDRELTE